MLNNIGIDITIDPKAITISTILQKVRRGNIRSLYTIGEGLGEVIEAVILTSSSIVNKNIKEIEFPKNVRVGSILRNENIIIPNSKTIFHVDDDVVFYAEKSSISKLEELLAIKT